MTQKLVSSNGTASPSVVAGIGDVPPPRRVRADLSDQAAWSLAKDALTRFLGIVGVVAGFFAFRDHYGWIAAWGVVSSLVTMLALFVRPVRGWMTRQVQRTTPDQIRRPN
jgi:hypothetical protein